MHLLIVIGESLSPDKLETSKNRGIFLDIFLILLKSFKWLYGRYTSAVMVCGDAISLSNQTAVQHSRTSTNVSTNGTSDR